MRAATQTQTQAQTLTPAQISTAHDAELAFALASRLETLPVVMKRFNMTVADVKFKLRDPQFREVYREVKKKWNSPMSAKERLQVKAAYMAEDGLLMLYELFSDTELNASVRLDAYKQICTLADVVPKNNPNQTQPGERFSLTINLPQSKTIEVEGAVLSPEESSQTDDTSPAVDKGDGRRIVFDLATATDTTS